MLTSTPHVVNRPSDPPRHPSEVLSTRQIAGGAVICQPHDEEGNSTGEALIQFPGIGSLRIWPLVPGEVADQARIRQRLSPLLRRIPARTAAMLVDDVVRWAAEVWEPPRQVAEVMFLEQTVTGNDALGTRTLTYCCAVLPSGHQVAVRTRAQDINAAERRKTMRSQLGAAGIRADARRHLATQMLLEITAYWQRLGEVWRGASELSLSNPRQVREQLSDHAGPWPHVEGIFIGERSYLVVRLSPGDEEVIGVGRNGTPSDRREAENRAVGRAMPLANMLGTQEAAAVLDGARREGGRLYDLAQVPGGRLRTMLEQAWGQPWPAADSRAQAPLERAGGADLAAELEQACRNVAETLPEERREQLLQATEGLPSSVFDAEVGGLKRLLAEMIHGPLSPDVAEAPQIGKGGA